MGVRVGECGSKGGRVGVRVGECGSTGGRVWE